MPTCPKCGHSNADGARFCSNCGSPLETARPIEGERRFATVLFADVARSTSIAEKLDPEDWALIMNGAFQFMNAAVSKYGGTVSRLMGDAVLALFGAPVAHEDDAERAVRAGLELQEGARAYAAKIRQRHGLEFEVRVGINTGTAVLAFVGDAIKTEYTAMGDAANVAARLQSAAEPGTVLISADTQRLVHAQFELKPRGAIEMKGKAFPVETFEVLGAKAIPTQGRGLEGLTSPLVGRDREIGLLREKYAALKSGLGAVVAVVGEAGLGKSRLLAELRHVRDADAEKSAWFEARAISYGMAIPYYQWRQIGRQMVGGTEMDGAAALRDKLHEVVERAKLPAGDVPFLETMMAADGETSRVALAGMAGEAIVNGVAGAVVNAVKAAIRPPDGGVRPHVLVMDDLHWADNASLELIAQVGTLAAFEPLLVVCVLRPDRKAPSWQLVDRLQASLGSAFERIDLEPLSGAMAAELLGNLLQIEDLPESVRAQILERSEGNPFYLEEVLRSLIDGGQVVQEGGHWRATRDILDVSIPDTLAGVLSARIDRLPEMTKRVAQTAAVIGRVFQHRLLESVCRAAPGPERIEHVEPHIAALSYEQLVRERSRDPEREYIFKHALTCDAAYELLLRSRRKDLHARCGTALELLFADRQDEFAAMLAHHFAEAGDPARTLDYSQKAADNARRLYALKEEVEHRERALWALDRLPDEPRTVKIDAIMAWVSVRHLVNHYGDEVFARINEAVAMSRAIDDKRRLARSLTWIANIHMVTGFPSRGAEALQEADGLASELGDPQLLLLPLFVGTFTLVDRDPNEGAKRLQEVAELAREHHMPEVQSHAMAFRAVALARIGDFDAAHKQIDEALAFAPHAGSQVKQADVHISVAAAYYDMGEIQKGIEHGRIGAEMALAANGLECACAGYFELGRSQLVEHRLDEALDSFGLSERYGVEANFMSFVNAIRGSAAFTKIQLGHAQEIEKLRAAVTNAHALYDEYTAATMSQQLADALISLRRTDEALPFLESAIAYYRERGMRPYLSGSLDLLGKLHQQAGRVDAAQEAKEEAAKIRAGIGVHAPLPLEQLAAQA